MKRIIFAVSIAACIMISVTVQNAQASSGEVTRSAVIKGSVVAIPCERNLPEGETCILMYYQPKARIEVFKMTSYDNYPLAYERVNEIAIPDETAPFGQQDTFELSLAPGNYFFIVRNGRNGQQSTLGPIDVMIGVVEARLDIRMYNHKNDRPEYDLFAPRDICIEYAPQKDYASDPAEVKLLPTMICSSIEPDADFRNFNK